MTHSPNHTKHSRHIILQGCSFIFAIVTLLAAALSVRGADGTWTNEVGGNWSATANWLGGTVADTAASTANFNTLDLLSPVTATLDSARTIGSLIFGDTDTATPSGWILDNGGTAGNTLNVTNIMVNPVFTDTIFNSTNDAIISAVVTGSGLVKQGSGTLTLQGANTMGLAQLDQGLVGLGSATALGSQKVIYNGGGVIISTTATITTSNQVLTTGHIYSPSANYDNFNGRWTGSGTMYIHNTSSRLTLGGTSGSTALLAGFNGTIDMADSAGGLLRIGMGSGTLYDCSAITFNLSTNGYLAPRMQSPGTFKIGSLSGLINSRCAGSENGGGSPMTWDVGGLNTSTVFEGRFVEYTSGRVTALNKVGAGTLTLTHNGHAYLGATTISGGTLALTGTAALNTTPSITVGAGAMFDVSGLSSAWGLNATQSLGGLGAVVGTVSIVNGTISPGASVGTLTFSNNLALGGLSVTTNVFEIGGVGTNDTIRVVGDLTLTDTVIVRLVPSNPAIQNGSYVLYKWDGTLTGDTNNLQLEYPPQGGTVALAVNNGSKEITLEVSGVAGPANLTWKGDGSANDWDLTTANWLNGVTPSLFKNGDSVTFNNTGSNNVPVNVALDVNPATVTFNGSIDYTLGSTVSAGIVGTGGLLKTNTGALTILNNNSYSGGTTIQGGVLRIGDNANPAGSIGSGPIVNNATLVYNRPDDLTGPGISGSGSVIQTGSGILSLNSAGSYAGGTTISNGTVAIGNNTALGTGTATLAGGALSFPAARTIVNNVNVVSSSTITFATTGNSAVVLNGDLTGGGGTTLTITPTGASTASTRVRLGSGITNTFTCDSDINLNGTFTFAPYNHQGTQTYNGVISGSGIMGRRSTLAGTAGTTILNGDNTYSGGTVIADGVIGFGINSTGSPTVTSGPIGTGALTLDGTAVAPKRVYAAGGARTVGNAITWPAGVNQEFVIEGSNPLTLSGDMDLGGSVRTIATSNSANTVLGGVIGNGGLTKTGPGVLLLNGANGYTDTTTVSEGTLGGSGSISGPVVVSSAGKLAPGSAAIGTLTLNSDLTISGGLVIDVNKSLVQSNDVTSVVGGLTNLGTGTVVVTNLGPALVAGDRFLIFDKAVVGGESLVVTGGGVSWLNKLAVDGSIEVTATPTPASITYTKISSTQLELTWPTGQGWKLQTQTNALSTGLTSSWTEILGATPPYTNTISPGNPTVFFRLVYP